jgi:H/ACA ribonucleoprotein complex subunit 4
MSDADAPLRPAPEARSVPELLAFGVVNLDKPPGPSAHQVAAWARDLAADALGAGGGAADDAPATVDRAAHAGTLDPKVTGCLPLLLGDATRLAQALDDAVKEYVAVLELHRPAPADTDATVAEFEGPLLQKPPRKSAVSRRLRTRTVHELDLLEREDRRALLRIECEAGTYVRKLCHDLGLALGTGGNMGALRRTGTGSFDDTTLRTMHDYVDALAVWREDGHEGPLRAVVQPAERVLTHLPRVTVAPSAARAVATGAPVYAPGVLGVEPPREGTDEGVDPQPGTGEDAPLVAGCVPSGAAVCLGRLVGDPDAERGTVVDLERVLV